MEGFGTGPASLDGPDSAFHLAITYSTVQATVASNSARVTGGILILDLIFPVPQLEDSVDVVSACY